jgi:NACHT domain
MLSSMGVHLTQHRATFILTIRIQVCRISEFQVCSEEHPYRRPYEGLRDLKLVVSLGAIHDSAERQPPPNCHPDTRKAVRQIILDWIHSESADSSFFWLYGPAGAGKTAILQAIAELLCSPSGSDQNFGGSFFFSRGKQGRDQGHFLFSTIAYQLALKVPGLRQHVNRIMELDPTLHTKSMDVQLQTLIVDAFRYLSPPQHSYLVIIDGLDECHDKATQQMIIRLLCETITFHKLPLRFLIGSRPESHIRASFDKESLYTITHRVVLDETFDPGRDIRVFLQDGFAKLCADNSILSHVEQPWPNEGIIDLLVQRSSGQFIYAATVLKFVRADFCSPTKRLALVLKPDPRAFSDLDQLYTQILSVYPSEVNVVQVLGFIIGIGSWRSSEVIEDILEMEEGELKLVLCGLSSLMEDENGKSLNKEVTSYVIPHFVHASFSDYLLDSSRSGLFHVDQQEYGNQITIRSFALIMQSIRWSWG